jgi:propionyl-CoA carboxylase alpha chain
MWIVFEHQGQRRRCAVVVSSKGTWVGLPGNPLWIPKQQRTHASYDASQDAALRAPMTAKVVHVHAQEGAHVEKSETLLVLEAMKMEYRIAAPYAGKVLRVQCKVGDLVDLGDVLVVLEQ